MQNQPTADISYISRSRIAHGILSELAARPLSGATLYGPRSKWTSRRCDLARRLERDGLIVARPAVGDERLDSAGRTQVRVVYELSPAGRQALASL